MKDPKIIGYKAMFNFLEAYYERGKSDEIGGLLGDLSLLDDGSSADPAMMEDWDDAYQAALKSSDDDYRLDLK